MKKQIQFFLILFLMSSLAWGGNANLCNNRGSWLPWDDVSSPAKAYYGPALTISRAHDATHVATYTPNGSTAWTNASANQGRLEGKGELIEGGRGNIFLYSEDASQWSLINVTVLTDQAVSPDGNTTADKCTGSTGSNWIYDAVNVSANANPYVSIYYVKQGDSPDVKLWHSSYDGTWTSSYLQYTFATDTLLPTGSYEFYGKDDIGNGWIRLWLGHTNLDNTTQVQSAIDPALGSAGSYTYVFGRQVEQGSFPSSYIPTAAAAISRNADDLSMSSSAIDNTAGAVAVDWYPIFDNNMVTGAEYPIFAVGTLKGYYNATDQKLYITDGTDNVVSSALSFSAGDKISLSFRWGAGGMDIYKDGTNIATGASFTEFAPGDTFYWGRNVAGDAYLFGHLKNGRTFKIEPSDSEMYHLYADNWTGDYCQNPVPDFGNFPSVPRMR